MIKNKPCSILCSSRAKLDAKLEELEAENQRLREAAEAVMRHRGIHRYFKPMDVAIDALIELLEGGE